MKRSLLTLATALAAVGIQDLRAQSTLERHIENRERRIAELTQDIIRANERIESDIDSILSELKKVTDSNDSQTNVARIKEKVIAGLIKSIEVYDQKRRAARTEAMKKQPKIDRDTLFGDEGKFDERIEKRVGQILGLANTLEEDKDYQRWLVEYRGSRRWGRNNDRSYRRNPDYLRNRKEGARTKTMKKELATELEASIKRLDTANRSIKEKLKLKMTDDYRQLLTSDLERNEGLISEREKQIEELLADNSAPTTKISRDRAHDIGHMIEDMADDLRREFNGLFATYAELNLEREALKKLRDRLAASKKSE